MTDRRLRRVIAVLALVGVGIAGYLTWVHYAGDRPLCLTGGGCEKVQTSEWSKLAGVPVALIGLIGYLSILLSLLVRGELGKLLGAGMALIGFGFSAYLTYRELFTIEAICQWCVASAAVMTLIALAAVWRLLRIDPAEVEAPVGADAGVVS